MTPSNQPQSALPAEWVERIFKHMACSYGSKFADLWAGQEPETVRGYWAIKLGGFADQPEAIKAAIESLDARPTPPTLPEFIALCRAAANRNTKPSALPPPQMSREDSAECAAKVGAILRRGPDPLLWARRLREKYLAGEHLLPVQINLASEALGEKWAFGKIEAARKSA